MNVETDLKKIKQAFEEKEDENREFRPEVCKSFPHLHKEGFVFRLMGVIQNYEICPIVFNVYEQLKIGFRHY